MLRRWIGVLGVQACAFALASAAWSAELSKDYLAGTWAVGGIAACGTASAEQMKFVPDGTFSAMREDKPTAVGFWFLVEDNLDLHLITSPAFFDDPNTRADDLLSSFAAQFSYFYAQALLFDVADDDFRMVASMGNMMRGANLGRCPTSG